jgi:hypothetical protein
MRVVLALSFFAMLRRLAAFAIWHQPSKEVCAMPAFRLTFFFEQLENGWSESIHTTATDTLTLIALATGYANRRMAFCQTQTFLTHIRISDDEVFRDVILDPIPLPMQGAFKPAGQAEGPWTALDARMSANPRVQRSLFVRGFPAGQINSNAPAFTAAFQAAYTAWTTYITDNVFAIKNKDRAQQKQPIDTISAAGVVRMANPIAGLANLATVQVLGIPRSQIPKRTFTVVNFVDGSNFTLRGYTGPVIAQRGYLRLVTFSLLVINQIVTDFVTERRVGRPFGVLRGRRAVVR